MMKNKLTILKVIGIILLIISIFPVDYFFYQILKWYIFILSGYLAYKYNEIKKENWAWIFGITAIVYNPIASIYFGRELWMMLDIILIIMLIYNLFQKQE